MFAQSVLILSPGAEAAVPAGLQAEVRLCASFRMVGGLYLKGNDVEDLTLDPKL
jgi:hypothetical protein